MNHVSFTILIFDKTRIKCLIILNDIAHIIIFMYSVPLKQTFVVVLINYFIVFYHVVDCYRLKFCISY